MNVSWSSCCVSRVCRISFTIDPLPQPLSNSALKVKPLSLLADHSPLYYQLRHFCKVLKTHLSQLIVVMVDCLFRHRQPNVAKAVPTLDSPTLSSISCTSHQLDKHRHFIHNRSLHTRSNRGCMLVMRIRLS